MKSTVQKVLPAFVLLALMPFAQAEVLQDHAGLWLGDLQVPKGPMIKWGVDIFTRADGSTWASVASPDYDAYDIPVKSVQESGDSADLDLSFASMQMTWDKDHFNGVFKGRDGPIALVFRQVDKFPMKVRPQTPKAPFPYKNETLAITSSDGVMLGATLSIPDGKLSSNVVVLVHGSGPNNRDEESDGHQPFAVLADYFVRHGIAVLRYDKRGIARSTGDYAQHTETQLAEDVYAALQTLKARHQFKRVGIIGHSEGPGIAAMVASRHPESVDFLVSMAGVGLPGLDMMLLQDRATASVNGARPKEVEQIVTYVHQYYDIIIAQAEVAPRMAQLNAYIAHHHEGFALTEKYKMLGGSLSLKLAEQPELRDVLMANTPQNWRGVKCPVMALNGSVDQQVPGKENLKGIVAAIKSGGNQNVTAELIPSLNHMFQTAKTGAEDEYGKIAETVAPVVMQKMANFVLAQ